MNSSKFRVLGGFTIISLDEHKKKLLEYYDPRSKRIELEAKRLSKLKQETFEERLSRMLSECPTRVIVSGSPDTEGKLWCGPKYLTEVFHHDGLIGQFFLSRDSTESSYSEGIHDERYSTECECPPGVYYATENLWNIKGDHPNVKGWLELSDIRYGYTIKGPMATGPR